MVNCQKCQRLHDGVYGSGRFCNKSCSNGRKHTDETKYKIKLSLTGRQSPRKGIHKKKHNNTPPIDNLSWSSPRQIRLAKKLCRLFSIPIGESDTADQLTNLVNRIKYLYLTEMHSVISLKSVLQLDLPDSHMTSFISQLGIQSRTRSEAARVAINTGRSQPARGKSKKGYKTGWHINWLGVPCYYRSSYELNIYETLDFKRKSYTTESLRIEYLCSETGRLRIAIPDILYNNIILEIKSNYTYNYTNMRDKFVSYREMGYKPYLILDHALHWLLPPIKRGL